MTTTTRDVAAENAIAAPRRPYVGPLDQETTEELDWWDATLAPFRTKPETVADVFHDGLLQPDPEPEVPAAFGALDWHVLSRVTGDELRVESVRGTSADDAIRRAGDEHGGSWHVTTDEEWQRHVAEDKAPF